MTIRTLGIPSVRHPRLSTGTLVTVVPYALVFVLLGINLATIEGYGTKSSMISLLVLASFLGLASVGQTLAVIIGAVDLSIPAVIGLSDVVLTQLYGAGWPFWLVALVILGLASVIGVVNALATVYLRVHAIIITLAMGLIVTGGVLTWRSSYVSGSVPPWLRSSVSIIGTTGPIAVPRVVFFWLAVSIVIIVFQRATRLGREVYALGANPVAAPLTLVRTTWVYIAVFMISAIFAAVVGCLFAGFGGTADSGVGQPYFFQTITAVVIGGTSLLGGRGGYGRTIAGSLILIELTTLLIGQGFNASMQEALLGILIVLIVIAFGRESHISLRV